MWDRMHIAVITAEGASLETDEACRDDEAVMPYWLCTPSEATAAGSLQGSITSLVVQEADEFILRWRTRWIFNIARRVLYPFRPVWVASHQGLAGRPGRYTLEIYLDGWRRGCFQVRGRNRKIKLPDIAWDAQGRFLHTFPLSAEEADALSRIRN